MKKIATILAAVSFALAAPLVAFAMDHESMPMEHGSMEHGGHKKAAHEEVVDGVKATFDVYNLTGMKETHHIMVTFTDAKTGKPLSKGEAKIKVVGPDKAEQVKDLMAMGEGFGANFTMPGKGKYGVMCKFKLADGKVRTVKFWYTVK